MRGVGPWALLERVAGQLATEFAEAGKIEAFEQDISFADTALGEAGQHLESAMGLDDESSHPALCSEVADGVTHFLIYPGTALWVIILVCLSS